MADIYHPAQPTPALVSRPQVRTDAPDEYLQLTPQGAAMWTTDPAAATPFVSMREATRAAARLPGSLRAYGVPIGGELGRRILH